MKTRTLAGLLSALALGSSIVVTDAEVRDNPYQVIVTRNAFALKPPPPPVDPAAAKNEPPPSPVDVVLTGIATLGGNKKALLQITDKSPSKAGKTEYPPPLVEGDIQGRVEVVSIDAENNKVVIKIDGNEKTLGFNDKEAAKPAGPAGAPAAPGAPPPATGPSFPSPFGTPAPVAAAPVDNSSHSAVVVGGGYTPSAPASVGSVAPMAGAATLGSSAALPSRPLRTGIDSGGGVMVGGGGTVAATTPAPAPSAPPMTRPELIQHLQGQQDLIDGARAKGFKVNLPPLPPPPMPGGPRSAPATTPTGP